MLLANSRRPPLEHPPGTHWPAPTAAMRSCARMRATSSLSATQKRSRGRVYLESGECGCRRVAVVFLHHNTILKKHWRASEDTPPSSSLPLCASALRSRAPDSGLVCSSTLRAAPRAGGAAAPKAQSRAFCARARARIGRSKASDWLASTSELRRTCADQLAQAVECPVAATGGPCQAAILVSSLSLLRRDTKGHRRTSSSSASLEGARGFGSEYGVCSARCGAAHTVFRAGARGLHTLVQLRRAEPQYCQWRLQQPCAASAGARDSKSPLNCYCRARRSATRDPSRVHAESAGAIPDRVHSDCRKNEGNT